MLRSHCLQKIQLSLVLLVCLSATVQTQPAAAENISELLEKAIYTEETVGDLDEAIRVYEKVVAEGKDSLTAAAQAQFRIGTCYAKQGKTEEATAAFQAVIDNYPQATDLVAKAKSRVPDGPELLPVPWGDGDELHFEMKLATGLGVGHQVFRVGKLEKNGRAFWECSAWQTVTINGMAGKSRVLIDYETFAPVESQWKHTLLGESEATYGKGQVVIKMASKDEPITLDFDGSVYDNEQGAEMFRRLPLKEDYKTTVNIIPILTGVNMPLPLRVTKIETIEVPVGKFECFCLYIDGLNQSFWISNDEHRYIVRFEAGGVTADLTEVRQYQPNQSTPLKHERFSATLPPDWYAYTPSNSEKDQKTKTALIDPEASVSGRIIAAPLEVIQGEHGTPREWLESGLEDNPKKMKDFSLSEQGVESITLGGRDAATVVYEFLDKDKPMKARRILLFGDSSAVDVRFSTATDEYDKWQPAFEEILASLKIE